MSRNSHHELFRKTGNTEKEYTNRTYRLTNRNVEFVDQLVMRMQLEHKVKFSRNELVDLLLERLREGLENRPQLLAEAARSGESALDHLLDLAFGQTD